MPSDHYCYEGTDVLRNLLDIRDPEVSGDYEHLLTSEMAAPALSFAKAEMAPTFGTLTSIHYLLFGEFYEWAGKARTVGMSRNGVPFMATPIDGNQITRSVIEPFEAAALQARADKAQFALLLGDLWSKLNFCHPFRDGNGRTTQLFITALAQRHGWDIDWPGVSRILDNVAGMASQRGNPSGFIGILQATLRTYDPAATASFW